MPSEIWVPPSSRARYRCDICGDRFYAEEEDRWARHVARCAKKHREELVEAAEHVRRSNPLEHAIDEEALEFQRKRYGSG